MLIDWGHMGDLRTTINHGSVSCLKLLNAWEPAREQHLCAQTSCGASETQPDTNYGEALPWEPAPCALPAPPAGGEHRATCTPCYGEWPEHGDGARVSKYLDSWCFWQYFGFPIQGLQGRLFGQVRTGTPSAGHRACRLDGEHNHCCCVWG